MKRHPFFLVGWLLAATVLLSLVGLTAKPLPVTEVGAGTINVSGTSS
ncbi:MAG: hypothetical protein ACR2RF_12840 [Geminicoccaceae bacterium]